MADIISAGQTQCTIDALMRGEADEKSVQVAIASTLMAVARMTEDFNQVKSSMWKREELVEFIDKRHREKCDDCPAKRYVDALVAKPPPSPPAKKSWYAELVSSESLRYFVLVLILVWTVVKQSTTQEQSNEVLESVRQTMMGGVVK